MLRKLFHLILFAFFLSFALNAQPSLLTVEKSLGFVVPYHKTLSEKHLGGNTILREMAKEVLKEPWLVRVEIGFTLRMAISQNGVRDTLFIRSGNVKIKGDTLFRGFGITDVLCPSRINLAFKWANREDTTGYTEQEFVNLGFNAKDTLLCSIPVGSFDPEVDTLLVSGMELFYDSSALTDFLSRLGLVHNYYASLAIFDSIRPIIAHTDLSNHAILPYNYFRINEINKALEAIETFNFSNSLLPGRDDIGGLVSRYKDNYRTARSLTFNFLDELKKVAAIPWDGKNEQLADYFTKRTVSWIRRTQLMDKLQGSIYREFLKHYFDHPSFPEENNVGSLMLSKMFPGAKPDSLSGFFAGYLYNSMQKQAEFLVSGNHFADAFMLMEFARIYATGDSSLTKISHNYALQQLAAEGIFNSFVGIASGCLKSRKFHMADTYLTKADDYAKSNPQWVKTDSAYREVFSELFFLRNTDCDRFLEDKNFQNALECYENLEDIYSSRDLAVVGERLEEKKNRARVGLYAETTKLAEIALNSKEADSALIYDERALALRKNIRGTTAHFSEQDSLAPEMAKLRYKRMFEEGTVALQKSQFTLALSHLKVAKGLSAQFRITPVPTFDSVYRRALKHYLLVQLSVSQKKIWANQFDSAQAAVEKIRMISGENGLENDPDLGLAMTKYKFKIQEQKCRNTQDSIDLQIIRADRSIAVSNYINATRYFRQAVDFCNSDAACTFNAKSLMDSMAHYETAARYQLNHQEINALVVMGEYQQAVRLFSKNNQLFDSANLSVFGLRQTDLYKYITDKNNPNLAEAATQFMYDQGRPSEAIRYLLLTDGKNPTSRVMYSLQENIGRSLAMADLAEHPEEGPKAALLKYQEVNERFETFRKAYMKEMERKH